MPIIEKAPNRYKQGTEVAASQAKATSPLLAYRATRKVPRKLNEAPRKAPRSKTACYYPYPLAILIEDAQILTDFAIPSDLALLLHEVIERLLIELAKRLLACV